MNKMFWHAIKLDQNPESEFYGKTCHFVTNEHNLAISLTSLVIDKKHKMKRIDFRKTNRRILPKKDYLSRKTQTNGEIILDSWVE